MNVNVAPPNLICVDPDRILELWPMVSGLIDKAYEEADEVMPPELAQWLADRKGQLWIYLEGVEIIAALTTSIVPMRSGRKILRMICCGGTHLDIWKPCHERIEEFARAEKCDRVRSEGRPGWTRVLGIDGYKVTRVMLEKRL